jgi:hypothetical protein
MGQKVVQIKASLEIALEISHGLHEDRSSIEKWMDTTESELDEREANIPPRNILAEIEFAENALMKMTKLRSKFNAIKDDYSKLIELCDRNSISAVKLFKDRWAIFEKHWTRLQTRLSNRAASMKVCSSILTCNRLVD